MTYAPAPQGRPAPIGRARRPLWHWLVVGGIAAVGLLIVAAFGVFILIQVVTRGNPEHTLDDFYTSLQEADCELFMESTTEEYQSMTGMTSCSIFDGQVSGVSGVDYEVTDRINRQGYAIFEVTETYSQDGEEVEVQLRFYVRRLEGQWGLDGIELLSEDSQPIT